MSRTRGFTLIEVLVALAIVAIGMAAVLGALTSSANTVAYLRDKTFAQWVALNQIATLRLSGQMTPAGKVMATPISQVAAGTGVVKSPQRRCLVWCVSMSRSARPT